MPATADELLSQAQTALKHALGNITYEREAAMLEQALTAVALARKLVSFAATPPLEWRR